MLCTFTSQIAIEVYFNANRDVVQERTPLSVGRVFGRVAARRGGRLAVLSRFDKRARIGARAPASGRPASRSLNTRPADVVLLAHPQCSSHSPASRIA